MIFILPYYLKDKNHNVFFLQDIHFTCDEEQNIQIFWGGKIYFSSFKTNSRGVAILFKNNFDLKVKNTTCDANGNFLIVEVEIENKDFLKDLIFLDTLLIEIRGETISYATFKNKLQNETEKS